MKYFLVFILCLLLVVPANADVTNSKSLLFENKKVENLKADEVCAEAVYRLMLSAVKEKKSDDKFSGVMDKATIDSQNLNKNLNSFKDVVTEGGTDNRSAFLAAKILSGLKSKMRYHSAVSGDEKAEEVIKKIKDVERNVAIASTKIRTQKMRNPMENVFDKIVDSKIEKFLGKMMLDQMINDIPAASPEHCAKIEALGKKIMPHAKKKRKSGNYIEKALDWRQNGEPVLNAVCLPDGYFFVSESLIDLIGEDKDALAFVIGHECGHHVDKDAIKKIRLMLVTLPGRLVLKKFVAKFIDIPLSRRDEFQADKLGVQFNQAAKLDPRGGIRCLKKFAEYFNEGPTPPPESTHPSSMQRVAKIEKYLGADK